LFVSPQPPVRSAIAENLQQLQFFYRWSLSQVIGQQPMTKDKRQKTNGDLPGRLGNAGNFSPQCQTAEAKPAKPELAEIGPRPSANLAAVVPTRGKLGFWLSFAARQLKLLLDLRVLDSFCCRCQLSSCNYSSILVHSENALTETLGPERHSQMLQQHPRLIV
jgi:hypothetical protein